LFSLRFREAVASSIKLEIRVGNMPVPKRRIHYAHRLNAGAIAACSCGPAIRDDPRHDYFSEANLYLAAFRNRIIEVELEAGPGNVNHVCGQPFKLGRTENYQIGETLRFKSRLLPSIARGPRPGH